MNINLISFEFWYSLGRPYMKDNVRIGQKSIWALLNPTYLNSSPKMLNQLNLNLQNH